MDDTADSTITLEHKPKHVAIIMDGNGRWAKQRNRPRTHGHRAGVQRARDVAEYCLDKGIKTLSLFAFSSENWQRPADEVNYLFDLFIHALSKEAKKLHKRNVKITFIGNIGAFPDELQQRIQDVIQLTHNNTALHVVLAVNYGGRWDIVNACRQLLNEGQTADTIDETKLTQAMSLAEIGDPDLIIRTSGEQRISNFFLWQAAYSELYFCDTLWPDFDEQCFEQALMDFAYRERRYGRTK